MVGQFGYTFDKAPPRLSVRTLEGVIVAFGAGPDDEVRSYLGAKVYPVLEGVYPPVAQPPVRVNKGALAVGGVGVEASGDHGQVHPVTGEDSQNSVGVLLVYLARVVVLEAF